MQEACPDCGTRATDWLPQHGGDRNAFYADFTYCQGCARIHQLRKDLDDDDHAKGVHMHLVPKDDYLKKMAEQDLAEARIAAGERP